MELFPISVFRVADRSMVPAVFPGDFLVVDKWYGSVSAGDIVVLKHPKKNMYIVKRVKKVDGAKLFVEGDNKRESQDSRHFGAVAKSLVVGKLVVRL